MVEKSHVAGWLPHAYEPFREIGQKIADWFAPASDASAKEDGYEINVELPGVKVEDVDITIHENSLIVMGHIPFSFHSTDPTSAISGTATLTQQSMQ